uniref:Uncharacterized protein n=1 Tax=Pinguiococcus pyrenoidosus TaxID=172671 RepID=A0A6U0UG22_9STRA|mmetsp:Transcript_15340/g.58396  ORF Transcript_15340/g.58396 Transcript_15340/m.58396 type:complete len:132 (+) Transcript_15340:443-838(+)|eukprot:scaffold3927_cov295-Pinguiococcus_pyrenoidosus.AAC.2
MEERKASEARFRLFDSIAPVIPSFLSDVAMCLTLQEQVHVFQLVSKDFAAAFPRFMPLLHHQKPGLSPILEQLMIENGRENFDHEIPWDVTEGEELIYTDPKLHCTIRLTGAAGEKLVQLEGRLLPDEQKL